MNKPSYLVPGLMAAVLLAGCSGEREPLPPHAASTQELPPASYNPIVDISDSGEPQGMLPDEQIPTVTKAVDDIAHWLTRATAYVDARDADRPEFSGSKAFWFDVDPRISSVVMRTGASPKIILHGLLRDAMLDPNTAYGPDAAQGILESDGALAIRNSQLGSVTIAFTLDGEGKLTQGNFPHLVKAACGALDIQAVDPKTGTSRNVTDPSDKTSTSDPAVGTPLQRAVCGVVGTAAEAAAEGKDYGTYAKWQKGVEMPTVSQTVYSGLASAAKAALL